MKICLLISGALFAQAAFSQALAPLPTLTVDTLGGTIPTERDILSEPAPGLSFDLRSRLYNLIEAGGNFGFYGGELGELSVDRLLEQWAQIPLDQWLISPRADRNILRYGDRMITADRVIRQPNETGIITLLSEDLVTMLDAYDVTSIHQLADNLKLRVSELEGNQAAVARMILASIEVVIANEIDIVPTDASTETIITSDIDIDITSDIDIDFRSSMFRIYSDVLAGVRNHLGYQAIDPLLLHKIFATVIIAA